MAPLLSTKLFIPPVTENHIYREPLLKKLLSDYQSNCQLALICAPAGYGKSTLVVEFLNEICKPSAWISLDEGDNDHNRFLSYLAAALKRAGVSLADDIDLLLQDAGFITTESILTQLLNSISESMEKVILVLDDYHVVRSQQINDIIKFILDHQPLNLFLVIITREDPQLPLARLRMKNKLTEYRLSDLVFTLPEICAFFRRIAGISLSRQAAEKIYSRTEGWIASLQLACLLLKNCTEGQADDIINKFDGTHTYIIDYLVEEVLEYQTAEIRDFLCKTSVLERMNDKLCDYLTDRTDSREKLKYIQKANLFLISLDDNKEWYRYHHLFADSLKTYLSQEEERKLYGKASVWMKANGFSYEAVNLAFKSKDFNLTLRTIEDSVEETFKYARLDSLVKWLEQLPEDVIKKSEALSVRKAIAYFATGHIAEAVEYIKTLDKEFENHASPHNKGLLFSIKAMMAGMEGQDAEPLAMDALELLEPWDPIARISALNTLGRAQFRKGKIHEAAETFNNAYESGLKLGYQFVTALALMNYSMCLKVTGKNDVALSLCHRHIEAMKSQFDKLPPYVGILYAAMAELYSETHETEKVNYFRDEGLQLCKIISYDIVNTLKMFSHEAIKGIPKEEIKKPGRDEQKKHEEIMLEYNEKLSEREIEILSLIAKGLSNQEIAKALFISANTTQWHITHIYSKLRVKSRTQAILKAKELNIEI